MANAWHCDGPGCDSWSRSGFSVGFIEVFMGKNVSWHFCSWDCLIKYGALKAPLEVISNE